jgi:hypothetical protein
MSYALVITDEAADRLENLIQSLAASRRAEAIDAVEVELYRLCANPLPKAKEYFGHPSHEFTFRVRGAILHWGVTYYISQDERSICITDCYKVPPPIL